MKPIAISVCCIAAAAEICMDASCTRRASRSLINVSVRPWRPALPAEQAIPRPYAENTQSPRYALPPLPGGTVANWLTFRSQRLV